MSIPLPERGQPLDVTYIYTMAQAISDLQAKVSSANYNTATVDTIGSDKAEIRTSDLKVIASRVEIFNNTTVTPTTEKDFSYSFTTNFKYAPIVTATPVNVGNTPAGKNVSVILKNITTSRVEGSVKFGASGDLSVWVNLIIVGVPN
jgi:hypothetical protein